MTRRVLLWSAGIAASIVAAVVGIVVYAADPGVLTYHVNLLLLAPAVCLVLYGAQRVLPYRVQWALAIVLAPVGAAAYLLWPNAQWWNYGALLALPLSMLATDRADRLRREKGDGAPSSYGAWGDGPWGPP
jgi:hypothetical protein